MTSLEAASPGNLIFFLPKPNQKWIHSVIRWGQRLFPSISTEASQATHVGIILPNDYVQALEQQNRNLVHRNNGTEDIGCFDEKILCIAHSMATSSGPHVTVYRKSSLQEKYDVRVISPLKAIEGLTSFTRIVINTALCFANVTGLDFIPTCSVSHFLLSACVAPKKLPKAEMQRSIAEGIVDYLFGLPRVEGFTGDGKKIYKTSFCGEYVHWVLQTAFLSRYLDLELSEKIYGQGNQVVRDPKQLQKIREECIWEICQRFDELFPEETIRRLPKWVLENSETFTPGKLMTVLTDL